MTTDPSDPRDPSDASGDGQPRRRPIPLVYDENAVPVPEPDASRIEISAEPSTGECGAYEFGRDIAGHLARLLRGPVTAMTYQENPWDRRPCPLAQFYRLEVAGRRVEITAYEVRHPLRRGSFTAFVITLDGQPVPFQRNWTEHTAWQIAREVWVADMDSPRPDATRGATTPQPEPEPEPETQCSAPDRATDGGADGGAGGGADELGDPR